MEKPTCNPSLLYNISQLSNYSWGSMEEDNILYDNVIPIKHNKYDSIVESYNNIVNSNQIESNVALNQESEEGNIEYKLLLIDKSDDRIIHLITQLNFRLTEGNGNMIYMLGVEDNGNTVGITYEEMKLSLLTIESMAYTLLCEIKILHLRHGNKNDYFAEVQVSRITQHSILDIKVCICGDAQSGKTTLVGVLTRGKLDNGNGSARMEIFRHRHEMENGSTSTITHEIIGFSAENSVINYSTFRNTGWSDIVRASTRIITLIDLAGNPKYQNTTIFGITSAQPDYSLIIVDAMKGFEKVTKEHLGICLALKIPFSIVITKIDLLKNDDQVILLQNVQNILNISRFRCTPFLINSEKDVLYYFQASKDTKMLNQCNVPIFQVSLSKGFGLSLLLYYFQLLPKKRVWSHALEQHAHFSIDSTYWVEGVGTVCAGLVLKGRIYAEDTLLLGPIAPLGSFMPVVVKSIHYKRVPVNTVEAGQHVSIALKKIKKSLIRRGMILTHPVHEPKPVFGFSAKVRALHLSHDLSVGYSAMIHAGAICKPASVVSMSPDTIKAAERGFITFKFKGDPEYITPGTKFLFRDSSSNSRGIGKIVKVFNVDTIQTVDKLSDSDDNEVFNPFVVIKKNIPTQFRSKRNSLPFQLININSDSVGEGCFISVLESSSNTILKSFQKSMKINDSDLDSDEFDEDIDKMLDKSLGAALDREQNITFSF